MSKDLKRFHNLNHSTTTTVLRLTKEEAAMPPGGDRLARLNYDKGWRDNKNNLLREENIVVDGQEVRIR